MPFYRTINEIASKYIKRHLLYKYGFNFIPMYRRTSAKITDISEDFLWVNVKLPYSYKNKNYLNVIFGGIMFASVDPFPLVLLMNLLDSSYVIWDKSAEIKFRKPAKEDLYASITYTLDEVEEIKKGVKENNSIEIIKKTQLTNKDKSIVYCEVYKTVYIADKTYFKQRKKKK